MITAVNRTKPTMNYMKRIMTMGNAINKTASNPMMYSQIRLTTYLVGVDGSQYGYGALQTASKVCTANDKLISIYFPLNIAVESVLFYSTYVNTILI